VYEPVPAARQQEAMDFLVAEGLQTPTWMLEQEVLRRIEHAGAVERIREAQVNILALMLEPQRMARIVEAEALASTDDAYGLNAMLTDLREGVWTEVQQGGDVDPFRRNLQRGYLEQMNTLMSETVETPDIPEAYRDYIQLTPVTLEQSDIRAAVRSELNTLRGDVQRALSRGANDATATHYEDILVRIDMILDPDADAWASHGSRQTYSSPPDH